MTAGRADRRTGLQGASCALMRSEHAQRRHSDSPSSPGQGERVRSSARCASPQRPSALALGEGHRASEGPPRVAAHACDVRGGLRVGVRVSAPPEPSPTGRRFLLWMHQADRADVAGCAEPHHGEARNWLLEDATDSAAGPDLSDIQTPRSNDRDLSHVYLPTMISTSQSSNSASVRSIITEPMPVLILVRRPTCQRPSRRTSPIEVEISSGS